MRVGAAKKGFEMVRIIRYVGMVATSILLMVSTALAQSFCPDFDRVIKLAPSGFHSMDVPNDVSVYINGVGETVAMSIREKDKVGHFDNGAAVSPLVRDQPAKPAIP